MIQETIIALESAKEKRKHSLEEIKNKSFAEMIEEKKSELQKEMEEKLVAYESILEDDRAKAINKLELDIATIEELICEFNEKIKEEMESDEIKEIEVEDISSTEEATVSQTSEKNTNPMCGVVLPN